MQTHTRERTITELAAHDAGPALITLHQVVKTYESAAGSFVGLSGIDLQIGAGEFVSIVGKSGSGKSTLINLITGIDRPSSGSIVVAGQALHSLPEAAMAPWRGRAIGVVFQFFQLLPTLTALENVLLPMDLCAMVPMARRQQRAMDLLNQVGMAALAHSFPNQLSGGQQQQVAIARALANDPPLIAADEPTGNLDSRAADEVFQLFERLAAGGKTILMVTHDQDLARRAQRTIVLADGVIVDERWRTPWH